MPDSHQHRFLAAYHPRSSIDVGLLTLRGGLARARATVARACAGIAKPYKRPPPWGPEVKNRLTYSIVAGMILGVIAGYVCHTHADAASAKSIAGYFSIITNIFLRLIKMIIAPLVFTTLVSGLAGMDNVSAAGRIG